MNDQQPTFKVTDRRLFNADGSPRELSPEERSVSQEVQEVPATASSTKPDVSSKTSSPRNAVDEPDGVSQSANRDTDELGAEELDDVQEPASFVNFVMSIASNAASALGMMEHPVTHERDVDLELGKHWIDVLGMLQKKTKGNLSVQEQKMMDGLLSDLRMQYVSLVNSSQKPRQFSGRDITGGR